VGSPVCEWVVPWLCCAAPPAARDRGQCTTDQPHPICQIVLTNQPASSITIYIREVARRDASSSPLCIREGQWPRTSQTVPPAFVMVRLRVCCSFEGSCYRPRVRIYAPLKQPHVRIYKPLNPLYTHVCTHIDSASGLAWRTVLRPHTSASSVHHLTPSHAPPPIFLT
jgi:hypothetical protein